MRSSLILLLLPIAVWAEPFTPAAEATGCGATVARNTMSVISSSDIISLGEASMFNVQNRIDARTEDGQQYNLPTPLCPGYVNNNYIAQVCSGFVVQDKYFVTNYHCLYRGVADQMSFNEFLAGNTPLDVNQACRGLSFVNSDDPLGTPIRNEQTFSCSRVLTYSTTTRSQAQGIINSLAAGDRPSQLPYAGAVNADFVIIELDRSPGTGGLSFSNQPLNSFTNVTTAGYPFGNGRVVANGTARLNGELVEHTAETQGGSSGSALVNGSCGVVGLHRQKRIIEGQPNFVFNEERSCFERNPEAHPLNFATPGTLVSDALNTALNPPAATPEAGDGETVESAN